MKKIYIDDIIASIFMIFTILIVTLNIGMRYFFNSPIRSAEEIATICFIWSVFIGGASCYRKKMHMGIDILTQMLPRKVNKYIGLKPTAVLGISSIYVNFSLVFGFGLIFIYSVLESIKSYKKLKMKGE